MIQLVYDHFDDQGPMPNGLCYEDRLRWKEDSLTYNNFNVLTRFLPTESNRKGWFPVLLNESSFEYKNVSVDNLEEGRALYVIEPNYLELSLILRNCFGNISKKAVKLIQQKKMDLVIFYAYEGFPLQQCHWAELVERSLGNLGITSDCVKFVFGDVNIEKNVEHYYKYHAPHPWYDFRFKNNYIFEHLEFELFFHLRESLNDPNEKISQLVEESSLQKGQLRPYKYLCLNGGGRPHRVHLLGELKRKGLLEHGLVSYMKKFEIEFDPEEFIHKKDPEKKEKLKFHTSWPKEIEPMYVDLEQNYTHWHNRGMTADNYRNSYFNVVTETFPAEPSFMLTEKVFKPLVNLQPLLVYGHPGTLKHLKTLGYESFPEVFDESYDNEEDSALRMKLIINEIDKACKKSLEEWDDIYWSVLPKLKRNRENFLKNNFKDRINKLIGELVES